MTNPYRSSRMREWQYRRNPLYIVGLLVLFPKFVFWKLDLALEEYALWVRLSEVVFTLTKPLRAVWGFVKLWAESRPWKLLWIASPVLILLFAGFTASFINANRNRGGVHAGYYQRALKAMNDQDYRQADFLFGKLIHHKNFKDNDQALFQALIASTANGNVSRAQALRKKLVEQREYEPARRWLVAHSLRGGQMEQDEAEGLVQMAELMVTDAPTQIQAEYWRKSLASLFMAQQQPDRAVEVLKQFEEADPEAQMLLARAYEALRNRPMTLKTIEEMLKFISYEDPDTRVYLQQRVEGLAVIAYNTAEIDTSVALMQEGIDLVERKRSLSVERSFYDAWLGELHLRMFEKLLEYRSAEKRLLAFEHFDRAIEDGQLPTRTGQVLNEIIDPDSGYPLLTGQILDVVVKRGGVSAHLARGMDAWVEGRDERTKFHFAVANGLNPRALDVVRYAALYLAREGSRVITVFDGNNKSPYQRALDLLQVVEAIDVSRATELLFDRCQIYSLRNEWLDVIHLLEPQLQRLENNERLAAYDWLMRSYAGLENRKRLEELQEARQAYVDALEEEAKDEE